LAVILAQNMHLFVM